jgi:hypothetical protein
MALAKIGTQVKAQPVEKAPAPLGTARDQLMRLGAETHHWQAQGQGAQILYALAINQATPTLATALQAHASTPPAQLQLRI